MSKFTINNDNCNIELILTESEVLECIYQLIIEYFCQKYDFDMDYQKQLEDYMYRDDTYKKIDDIFNECKEYADEINQFKIMDTQNMIRKYIEKKLAELKED